jgi:hypothetical protein
MHVFKRAERAISSRSCNNVDSLVQELDQLIDHTISELELDKSRESLILHISGLDLLCQVAQEHIRDIQNCIQVECKNKEDQARELLDKVSKQVATAKDTLKNAQLLKSPHLADMETYLLQLRRERDKALADLNQVVLMRNVRKEQVDKLEKILDLANEESKSCLEERERLLKILSLIESEVLVDIFKGNANVQALEELASSINHSQAQIDAFSKRKRKEEFLAQVKSLRASLICLFWKRIE